MRRFLTVLVMCVYVEDIYLSRMTVLRWTSIADTEEAADTGVRLRPLQPTPQRLCRTRKPVRRTAGRHHRALHGMLNLHPTTDIILTTTTGITIIFFSISFFPSFSLSPRDRHTFCKNLLHSLHQYKAACFKSLLLWFIIRWKQECMDSIRLQWRCAAEDLRRIEIKGRDCLSRFNMDSCKGNFSAEENRVFESAWECN